MGFGSGGGAKAGPGGTFGTWMNVACSIELPGEWAGLATAGNAEVFAVEGVFAQRPPLLLEKAGCETTSLCAIGCCFDPDEAWVVARPCRPERIDAAPCRRQHGQPRLRPSRAHRPQCCDQILRQPRGLISHDPAIDRQSTD